MKLDKLKKFMGMFGGISPPESRQPSTPAACESEMEYEIRTRTAAIFVSPEIASLSH